MLLKSGSVRCFKCNRSTRLFQSILVMIPSFGVKKAQPAFQVKAAAPNSTAPAPPAAILTEKNSLTAALPSPSVKSAATPVSPAYSSMAPLAPAPALAPSSTLPPVVHLPLQDAEAGVCSSDEDFEKENIHIDPKSKVSKSKKLKLKKDPDAPKKPATSYMFFCKQVRCSILRLEVIAIIPGTAKCDA